MKNIVHIDLNAFFAQVEEIKNPSLAGKPVAVGSTIGRSVVSTANYVARKYGVHSAMPISMARRLCPELIIVNDNYREYSKFSHKFMAFLQEKYPLIEQASIDECYIDMTGFFRREEAHDYLLDLQIELFKTLNLKCSIGVGDNRFLAKMASDYQKPLGLTILYKENIKDILWPISIEKMYGIGKKTFPKLQAVGIHTIGDLANTEDPQVKKLLGNTFIYHQAHANGEGNSVINTDSSDPKSISSARTFDLDTTDYEELKICLISRAKSISEQLKYYDKVTDTIVITFRNNKFVTNSRRMKFATSTNEEPDIVARALQVFDRYYSGEPLRLIGVGAAEIKDRKDVQEPLTLFQIGEGKPEKEIDALISGLNKKLAAKSLVKASSIKKKKKKTRTSNFHKPERSKK